MPSIDAISAGQGPASQKSQKSQKRRSLPFSPQSPLLAPATQATKPKLFAKEKSNLVPRVFHPGSFIPRSLWGGEMKDPGNEVGKSLPM